MPVDDAAWGAALDTWLEAAEEGAQAASLDAAESIKDRTQGLLDTFPHPPGIKTPSPPGGPPGKISGALSESIDVHLDPLTGIAAVGPTDSARSRNGPYGRSQEMGADFTAHSGYMTWEEDGRRFFSRAHRLPERPYLKPATEEAIASGDITDIYAEHWHEAQRLATGE